MVRTGKANFGKRRPQRANLTPQHHCVGKLPSPSFISLIPSWTTYAQYLPHASPNARQTQLFHLVKAAENHHHPPPGSWMLPKHRGGGRVLPGQGQSKGDGEGEASRLLPATVKPLGVSAAHGNTPAALIVVRLP